MMKMTWGLVLAVTMTVSAATKIEEQIVAPPWQQGTILTLSPKGMHVASMHKKGDKYIVMIDGVESPEYDDVLLAVPTIEWEYPRDGGLPRYTVKESGPVAFSPDGKRYAYAARLGDEVVVMLDGNELFRAKDSRSAPPVSLMQFTPDGQHLYFYNHTTDTMNSYQLMMDGKPVTPGFDRQAVILFSEDGAHWLMSAGKATDPNDKMLIVDGKIVDYFGGRARFTPDGKSVVCVERGDGYQKLLVNGKPMLSVQGEIIEQFNISNAGDIWAIVKSGIQDKHLYRNGKRVEAGDGVGEVVLSPDGRRWAASCMGGMGAAYWVVLDGKKGPDFTRVDSIEFSPDSTVCIYRGQRDNKWALMVNGEEVVFDSFVRARFATEGHEMIYAAGRLPNAMKVHHKGRVSGENMNVLRLQLSPDAGRYAYFVPSGANTTEFIVDGETNGYGRAFGDYSVFSPDSRHLAATSRDKTGGTCLYVDGQFLPDTYAFNTPLEFTPDSRHLLTRGEGPKENGIANTIYYLDGEPVAEFSLRNRAVKWVNSPKMVRQTQEPAPFLQAANLPRAEQMEYEFQPDGSIVFVVGAPGPNGFGPIKRITVTPDPETTFETWLAGVPAELAKAAAEEEAAKQKAADEAAAAKQQKADEAAAAAAQRKADYEAAVAAKKKAYAEAVEAKRKARLLQLENAKRAKQGLPPLDALPDTP